MKISLLVICFLVYPSFAFYAAGGLDEILPHYDSENHRIIPLRSHNDASLTVTVSYSKDGYFSDNDQFDILLIDKRARESWPWGSGYGRSRINRDGEGWAGVASLRNVTSAGFEIAFNITWKYKKKGNGEFKEAVKALWKTPQYFDLEGVKITVEIEQKEKAEQGAAPNVCPRHASCWLAVLAGRNRATGSRG